MTIAICELSDSTQEAYGRLLKTSPAALLYHSLEYRRLLRDVLVDARDRYLLAVENGQVIAALPAFVKTGPFGTVVNSLPFFGSHGSIVADPDAPPSVRTALLEAFDEMCRRESAVTATIVDNPFAPEEEHVATLGATLYDERISQYSLLPTGLDPEAVGNALMNSFHSKTRNLIRKACNGSFEFDHNGDDETLRTLHALHEANMASVGGFAKPWVVFDAIRRQFHYDRDYRVYTATSSGKIVAALLVFFGRTTAEYFTPAVDERFRSGQPLSGLIFRAMRDAVAKGCNRWNWGGTWLSQSGVYHFKSRWNTRECRYRYFTKEYDDVGSLRHCNRSALLEHYRYFYTLPFTVLAA